ncbi:MAG: alpha/beta fold hydrolase [Proteobacteria bacterium]|nr:alpha/beta fold hydrolase [Pseudomonadota bacterium]
MANTTSYPVISGTRIRMFSDGAGQPTLFLHGGAGLSVWTPFFQAMSESYDLRVPEHPGFGQSDNPAWLNSVSDLALFYLDFLESQKLEDVNLIGNSFGGWIAAEVASRDSSRLASLTLIGPAGLQADVPMPDIFRWSYEESLRKLFHNSAIAERMLSQPLSLEQVASQMKNQTTVTRLGSNPYLHNPDLPRWLSRIRKPTHIVWGAHDELLPASTAEVWKRHIPGAKVTIIADAGHLPHAERADVTAEAVKSFLATRK